MSVIENGRKEGKIDVLMSAWTKTVKDHMLAFFTVTSLKAKSRIL
jgi:hypothetical protein